MIGFGLLPVLLLAAVALWALAEGRLTMLRVLRGLYVLLLAGFVIMFVIFGIMAFYPGPQRPEFPRASPVPAAAPSLEGSREPLATPSLEVQKSRDEQQKAQQEYDQKREVFEQAEKVYHRNVFFVAFPLAVLSVGLGLLLPTRLEVFRPGLLLGGGGLVIYAVAQSQGAVGNLAGFLAVAVGLVVLVFLGYRQLVQKQTPEPPAT